MQGYDPKRLEPAILAFWKKNKIYDKAKVLRKGKKPFAFNDGPPYATGSIHVGTAWNKILKDAFLRLKRMQGFDVWDQPGYDCHGLPVETKVEQRLGFKTKKDIERYGVGPFVKKCRQFATQFIEVMSEQFADLGVWMDWSNPYLTLTNEYIEGTWYTFKKAFEKGLLYKGSFPVHVCTRCETVLAYNEIEYTTLADPSVWIKFKLKGREKEFQKEFLVIWTTTPWTIPGNTGVMAHPDFDYARVQVDDEILIIAKELVEPTMQKIGKSYKVLETVKGKELEGLEYAHPLRDLVPALQNLKSAHRVVLSPRFVHLEEGTGLVHTAPGHGWEDFLIGKEKGLPSISPVNLTGTFSDQAGSWLAGKYVKAADGEILAKLKERGALLHEESVTHDYPQCWRCDTPLLQISIPEWFFKIGDMRPLLIKENAKVNWVPGFAGDRFKNWLQQLGDWPVSRQRYWGIPLPIWECENPKCKKIEVIGSFEELRKKAALKKEIDFHKPEIDGVRLKCSCGGSMTRVPEILDVWFDSGASTWASLGYPRKRDLFKKLWPCEFQTEGPDQIRGWWNSQLLMSMMTFGRAPFKNILYHGFLLDLRGVKMAKSRGNIVTPEDVIKKYSRDVLRFYLLSSAAWDDFCWNWEDVAEVNKLFTIWWNCGQFALTYAKGKKKPAKLELEDKWILSRLNSLLAQGEKAVEKYHIHKFAQAARAFILGDFSRIYIKLIRDRVAVGYKGKDRAAAEWTLLKVLTMINKALAPITPFLTEHLHQQLFKQQEKKLSVHLCDWPKADKKVINKALEEQMAVAREIAETIDSLRAAHRLPLRWPLAKALVRPKNDVTKEAVQKLHTLIEKFSNVKEVGLVKEPVAGWPKKEFGTGEVWLNVHRDDKLIEEALVRELIRKVQTMRKTAGLKVEQKISLYLKGEKTVEETLKRWSSQIQEGTTSRIKIGQLKGKSRDKLEFEKKIVEIGF